MFKVAIKPEGPIFTKFNHISPLEHDFAFDID